MTAFEKVMMERDGMTREEAKRAREEASETINDIIGNGGSYTEVEDMMYSEYGLEMDYIMDLV